jgi:hypothetical protein
MCPPPPPRWYDESNRWTFIWLNYETCYLILNFYFYSFLNIFFGCLDCISFKYYCIMWLEWFRFYSRFGLSDHIPYTGGWIRRGKISLSLSSRIRNLVWPSAWGRPCAMAHLVGPCCADGGRNDGGGVHGIYRYGGIRRVATKLVDMRARLAERKTCSLCGTSKRSQKVRYCVQKCQYQYCSTVDHHRLPDI